MCLQGASRVAAALNDLPPDSLATFIVWVPMLSQDTQEAAESASDVLPEASHFWDSARTLAAQLGQRLGISAGQSLGVDGGPGLAWDVYLAYGPGKDLDEEPDFWM